MKVKQQNRKKPCLCIASQQYKSHLGASSDRRLLMDAICGTPRVGCAHTHTHSYENYKYSCAEERPSCANSLQSEDGRTMKKLWHPFLSDPYAHRQAFGGRTSVASPFSAGRGHDGIDDIICANGSGEKLENRSESIVCQNLALSTQHCLICLLKMLKARFKWLVLCVSLFCSTN